MNRKAQRVRSIVTVVLMLLTVAAASFARQGATSEKPKQQPPAPAAATNRLTIEVTGGDDNRPIENASVYLKTVEEHLIKDKKLEVNVKTNQKGMAHIPDPPSGKILVQIVADGWKTYGKWFEVTEANQVIKVHLERPPKWY
jgi:hypothetical protein